MTDKPKHRRRWLQFSLRTLMLVVTVFAIGVGLWTLRDRWWKYRLTSGADPQTAWSHLLDLSGIESRNSEEQPLNIWPQDGDGDGWVWVRHGDTLRCVTPRGKVLGAGGIFVEGTNPKVVWNGMLPNNRPGIAIYTSEVGNSYLLFVSVIHNPVVPLMVEVDDPGVTAALVGQESSPEIELKSPDGSISEIFFLEHCLRTANGWEYVSSGSQTQAPWHVWSFNRPKN